MRPCRSGISRKYCDLCSVRKTKKNLLVSVCESCQRQTMRFNKIEQRIEDRKKQPDSNPQHVNNRYLSIEEYLNKMK